MLERKEVVLCVHLSCCSSAQNALLLLRSATFTLLTPPPPPFSPPLPPPPPQVRIIRAVAMQFIDEVTDTLVLIELFKGGAATRHLFYISAGILAVPLVCNLCISFISNRKKGSKAMAIDMLAVVLHLGQAVHGFKLWRGLKMEEDDVFTPNVRFMFGRLCELVFEALPELLLQAYLLFHTKKVSLTLMVSLATSVAGSGFLMSDAVLTTEKEFMVSAGLDSGYYRLYWYGTQGLTPHRLPQATFIRGPRSDPVRGWLPLKPTSMKVVQAGLTLFYAGTITTASAAVASAMTVSASASIALVGACEYSLLMTFVWSRGQLYTAHSPVGVGRMYSWTILLISYLMFCAFPMLVARLPENFGGRFWFLFVLYRMSSYAGVVFVATTYFAERDGVEMAAATVRYIFGGGVGAIVVGTCERSERKHKYATFSRHSLAFAGGLVTFALSNDAHKWTWYSNKLFKNGPEYAQWLFGGTHLTFDCETVDQQRVVAWIWFHPSYLRQDAVKEWLLGLTVDTPLLKEDGECLPDGCFYYSGHSLGSFLAKNQVRYAFYGDPAASPDRKSVV